MFVGLHAVDWGLQAFRLILLAVGAAMGSFLAAAAWRLPRDRSLLTPSSCVSCSTRIPSSALIPVFGWFLARGRCASCGARVSPHYALVEAIAAVLTLVVFEVHGPTHYVLADLSSLIVGEGSGPLGSLRHGYIWNLCVSLWLLYTGVLLSLIDFEFRILPDVITLPGMALGVLLSWADPGRGWISSLAGIVSGAGSLWLIAVVYRKFRGRDGMGFGDVKYLGMIGAVLGWTGVLWTMMLASIVGSVVGVVVGFVAMRANDRSGSGDEEDLLPGALDTEPRSALQVAIPFGPFLAAGAFVYSLFDQVFIDLMMGGT